jgi:hypothetical protein
VYQTNADYRDSYEKLRKAGAILSLTQTQKGLIWFRIKGTESVFLLSPKGKLQIKWNNRDEKNTLLNIVKELLVPKDKEILRIQAKKQQVWIDYPPPQDFQLYWCDEATEYKIIDKIKHKLGLFDYLDRRAERQRIERLEQRAKLDALEDTMLKALAKTGYFYDTEIFQDLLHKNRKRYGLE